jgi:glutamine synthetase
VDQAIEYVQNILYNTSNRLYNLNLPSLQEERGSPVTAMAALVNVAALTRDANEFKTFLRQNPAVKYLHLQFVDYAAIRRGRVVPIKRARQMFVGDKHVGIQRGVLRMLPNDSMPPDTIHQGEWAIKPCIESLRGTSQPEMAVIMCEIQNKDGTDLSHDPRTVLRRTLQTAATSARLEFKIGFEIEVIFMKVSHTYEGAAYSTAHLSDGHCWSGAAPLESKRAVKLIQDVMASLEAAGVELEQYHSEGAKSQYEFILAPLPAMAAVEQLIAARAAIASAADAHDLRATLVPKIIGQGFGTGAHVHISLQPEEPYEHFYAGILRHMRGILALSMPAAPSFERMGDGLWSGGTWVCWGDQNREACLRRVERSHWECKVVDGLAHPYLVVAALIGAGMHGVAEKMELKSGNVEVNPGDLTKEERAKLGITERLPSSFDEALKALQEDEYLCNVLGNETIKTFVDVKEAEAKLLAAMEKEERQNWLVARY